MDSPSFYQGLPPKELRAAIRAALTREGDIMKRVEAMYQGVTREDALSGRVAYLYDKCTTAVANSRRFERSETTHRLWGECMELDLTRMHLRFVINAASTLPAVKEALEEQIARVSTDISAISAKLRDISMEEQRNALWQDVEFVEAFEEFRAALGD